MPGTNSEARGHARDHLALELRHQSGGKLLARLERRHVALYGSPLVENGRPRVRPGPPICVLDRAA